MSVSEYRVGAVVKGTGGHELGKLDTLIIDQVELPAALSLLRRTTRATNPLPTHLRRTLARAMGGR